MTGFAFRNHSLSTHDSFSTISLFSIFLGFSFSTHEWYSSEQCSFIRNGIHWVSNIEHKMNVVSRGFDQLRWDGCEIKTFKSALVIICWNKSGIPSGYIESINVELSLELSILCSALDWWLDFMLNFIRWTWISIVKFSLLFFISINHDFFFSLTVAISIHTYIQTSESNVSIHKSFPSQQCSNSNFPFQRY